MLAAVALAGVPRTARAASHAGGRFAALPLTITQTSDSALTLDSNSPATAGPHAMYVAYKITNTSSASVANLSATLSGFGTGVSLAGSQGATQYVGTLAAGASRTMYWFVSYPSTFNVRTVLTVSVTDGAGGSASGSGVVRTESMISAQAGGLTSASTIGPGAVVGQIIPLDVTFQFKGWKSGDTFNLQPAGNETFPAGCFQLVGSIVMSADASLSSVIAPGTADRQYFVAGVSSSGGGSSWTAVIRYYFKYLCSGSTGTPLPYSNELSGTQLKYSANYGTGGGVPNPIPPAPSPSASFVFSKTASVSQLPTGGSVTYTVTIQNTSTFSVIVDSLVDALPSGATYVGIASGSDVTSSNSGSVPSSGATGTVVWRGNGTSYVIAAAGQIALKYTVTLPSTAGLYVNSAAGYVGTTSIGTGSSTVTVGTADLSVTKSGTASAAAGDTLKYAITVANAGPAAAYGAVAVDTLPSGVTFVSATNGGSYASGVVTWPSVTIAANANVVDSVVVVGPSSLGSIVNIAAASASSYDPTASNNNGSAATSRVTTTVSTPVSVTPDGLASPTRRLPGTKYSQTFVVSNVGSASGTYALNARLSGASGVIVVDSITGAGITTRTKPDSAQVTLSGKSTTNYVVWYTVSSGDTAIAIESLRALNVAQSAYQDTGYVQIRRSFPVLSMTKSVSPTTPLPGTDVTYTITFSNAGESDAQSVVVADQVPSKVMFKVASAQQTLSGSLTSTVTYSTDNGTTWGYSPVSGGCGAPSGYDGCVTSLRWTLSAALPTGSGTNTVSFVARVR